MYKMFFYLLALLIVFTGCVSPKPSEENKKIEKKNKKVFEQEDALIMFGLRAEQLRDYKSASLIFDNIYEKSNKVEYLYRSLQNLLVLKENEKVIEKIDKALGNTLDNYPLIRLKIIALIQLEKVDEAQQLAINLVKVSKSADDYILVADIYLKQEQYDIAVKYLESAYFQNYNERILDKISIILYVNLDRKKDAIAILETHTRVHSCSVPICKRLIAFYSNDDNLDGLLSAYLRYYQIDSSPEISKQIVQLYGYKKDYMKLILFLQKSGSDDKTLLQLYVSSKNYAKAFPLAQKLYEENGDIDYFGESIIYEYEVQKNKNDKKFLKIISNKFEKLLAQDSRTLYLNYYGYILIDHNVDVKKGMRYVKKALKIEPNSAYYLDSLAWGYYKLGKCKESLSIIQKVITLDGGDDPEVLKHYELIKKCVKNYKGKK